MTSDEMPDIFEPFDRLVTVTICGNEREIPANNSILRGFQYLDLEGISYGDFCWNGECLNCKVTLSSDGKRKDVIACRTQVGDDMDIVAVSETIRDAADL